MFKWLAIIVAVVVLVGSVAVNYQPSLKSIHKAIIDKHKGVAHLSAQELSQLDPSQTIVFDIREEGEFDVSHIPNAVWVPPDLDAQEFIEDYGDLMAGKQAVFYCSVGRRSSEFVERVQQQGAKLKLANLESGLFNWVNESREVVGEGVHPYNAYWGRLIEDKNKINYKAKTKKEGAQ